MMAGKRLLDVAALFNASRGVAQKHAALLSRQLEVWDQTSSLAKAVKSQTDRITETAKATSSLASRLNERAPARAVEASQSAVGRPVSSHDSEEAGHFHAAPKEGLEQDHIYKGSEFYKLSDPEPAEDPEICRGKVNWRLQSDGTAPSTNSFLNIPKQDQDAISDQVPNLPKDYLKGEHSMKDLLHAVDPENSTIPNPSNDAKILLSYRAKIPQRKFEHQLTSQPIDAEKGHSINKVPRNHDEDNYYTHSKHTSRVLSSLPRIKIPQKTENTQGNDEHVQYNGINSDSYSAASDGRNSTRMVNTDTEQGGVLEGVNTDLSNSPRVAKLLGGWIHASSNGDLRLEASEEMHPGRKTPSSKNLESLPSPNSTKEAAFEGSENKNMAQLAQDIAGDAPKVPDIMSSMASSVTPYEMRESKIPSSRIGRLWNYGSLAAGMFGGAITESLRRAAGSGGEGSYMLSAGNMDRLVAKLSRMRGAALKLGQMMSFQDSRMLPAPIQQVLFRVQDSADYMPSSQRNKVLASNLGQGWRGLFLEFEEKPMAAASIGQVHGARLKSTGERAAVKVQYPGVADSIDSDLSNLSILLTASRLLPQGLYLERTIANARTELAWECDYFREAECLRRFQTLLSDEKDTFVVPKIYPEASGKQVLTMEYMDGIGVTKVQNFTQTQKDWIGTQILRLCLREITEFKFMQTDPNWTNFLYNPKTKKLELLDFGACREYPDEFISRYTRLLLAASKSEKDTVQALSIELGYLTGHESRTMLNAHISSVLTLAEPFLSSSPEVYDFQDQTITERVRALIPVMLRERLAPPPEETYSLHRKLSGAFLLCARLGSRVRCKELFENSMRKAGLLS